MSYCGSDKRHKPHPETSHGLWGGKSVTYTCMGAAVDKPSRIGRGTAPDGKEFTWGQIVKVHEIGPYQIVEYLKDASGYSDPGQWPTHRETRYSIYIDGKKTSHGSTTIEYALATAMAIKYDGLNSQAGTMFLRMIGFGGDE